MTPSKQPFFLHIHPEDNVVVALCDVPGGQRYRDIEVLHPLSSGHKMAIRPISQGALVLKYGFPIGTASRDIAPGKHVHTHNLSTALNDTKASERVETSGTPDSKSIQEKIPGEACRHTPPLLAYKRPSGAVGIRNDLWIIPTVACVNKLAEQLAERVNQELLNGTPHKALALTHPFGCSQLGEDHADTRRTLAALACHPNAGGVMIIGLGCENNALPELLKDIESIGSRDPERLKSMVAQDCEDEKACAYKLAVPLVEKILADERELVPLSALTIAVKCGGSDAFSGLTANPLIGYVADLWHACGGRVLMGEIPEMFGAESLLAPRCASLSIKERYLQLIEQSKSYLRSHGESVAENPSPGNKDGGITTLEEKSLGCVQKGGRNTPVVDILHRGTCLSPLGAPGLYIVDTPGNDLVSSTLLAATGAQIILFSTGRGTPFGSVIPTLKISSNTALAESKPHWIDFDAGRMLSGGSSNEDPSSESDATPSCIPPLVALGQELIELIRETASGSLTRNEIEGYQEIALFKQGVIL